MNSSYTLFFYCLSFFIIQNVNAQTKISGAVLNPEQAALEFANISLLDSNGQRVLQGCVTDSLGKFEFGNIKKGLFQIRVQYLGYDVWTKQLDVQSSSIDLGQISLQANANELGTVVVRAEREIIEKRGDQLLFHISSSPLRSGYDGIEILQRTPNVWVDGNNNILMREEAATVLINGRRLNFEGEALANYLKSLQAENIQRIEIQTNVGAGQDAESSGGLINIILKKNPIGIRTIARSHYTLKGDGFQSGYAGLNLNYGSKRWNLYGLYNHFNDESFSRIINEIFYFEEDTYLNNTERQNNSSEGQRYQLGLIALPQKNHQLGLELFGAKRAIQSDRNSHLSYTAPTDTLDSGTTAAKRLIDRTSLNTVFNYRWTLDTLQSNVQLIADYSTNKVEQNFSLNSFYDLGLFEDGMERNHFAASTEVFVLQPELRKKWSSGYQLQTGAKWTRIERDNELLAESLTDTGWEANEQSSFLNYQENVYAAFASISQTFHQGLFIRAGLRLEHTHLIRLDKASNQPVTQRYQNWFPALYLSKEFPNRQSLSASYSRRLRRPSFSYLTNNIIRNNDFNYTSGNPDLQPEYIGKYELSYQFKKNTFALYYNKVNDAINGIYVLDSLVTTYIPLNAGSQKQYGLEYNRSGKLFNWWQLTSSANFFHRKFTNEAGEDTFQQTSYSLRVSNNFKLNPSTNIDLTAFYISPKSDAFYEAAERYEVNLILRKSFLHKKWQCRIYIYDIFNSRRHQNRRPFDTFATTLDSKPRSRSIRFWMSYTFSSSHKIGNRKNRSGNDVGRRL